MPGDWRFALTFLLLALSISAQAAAKLDPLAKSIQIDPRFAYYRDRSRESVVSEIKSNGYSCVRMVITRDSRADAELVKAFRDAGMAVWYQTFGNGVYSTGDLPEGWESWRMKLRDKQPDEAAAGFVYLCLNDPEYRQWKKKQVVATLKRIPFDGFEIAEPFLPAFNGPRSPYYGCLCDKCRDAFLRMHPEERAMPDFKDDKSRSYYLTNSRLYRKWMDFRVRSVVSFLDDIINGPGGVREECPHVKVSVWGIADDIPNAVETIREWEGLDGALIAKTVRPDLYVIQTDWPDWSKADLPPEYPLKYKPFVEAIRAVSKLSIILQADVGSFENCRRGSDWMAKCDAAARKAGMIGITSYEYHLNRDIYEAPPRLVAARGSGETITLTFTKRLDPASASDTTNYSVQSGKVLAAQVDGNLVRLLVEGHPTKLSASNLWDDPRRRFFRNYPAAAMKGESSLPVNWR